MGRRSAAVNGRSADGRRYRQMKAEATTRPRSRGAEAMRTGRPAAHDSPSGPIRARESPSPAPRIRAGARAQGGECRGHALADESDPGESSQPGHLGFLLRRGQRKKHGEKICIHRPTRGPYETNVLAYICLPIKCAHGCYSTDRRTRDIEKDITLVYLRTGHCLVYSKRETCRISQVQ